MATSASGTSLAASSTTTSFSNDRLVTLYGYKSASSSTDPGGMTRIYTQNNATMNQTAEDQALGTPGTTGAKTVTVSSSTQAVMHTVALRPAAASTVRYAFTAEGDTPDAVLDTSNSVLEKDIGLPGGACVTIRASSQVWSYPNIHGDVTGIADQTGAKQGSTYVYDPFGNSLATGGVVPDDSSGNYDFGWLGSKQRGLEHAATPLPAIEMGARQYLPQLGRFIELDPIEGGSANDYDYVDANPLNAFDLGGTNCARMCNGPAPSRQDGPRKQVQCNWGKAGRTNRARQAEVGEFSSGTWRRSSRSIRSLRLM